MEEADLMRDPLARRIEDEIWGWLSELLDDAGWKMDAHLDLPDVSDRLAAIARTEIEAERPAARHVFPPPPGG